MSDIAMPNGLTTPLATALENLVEQLSTLGPDQKKLFDTLQNSINSFDKNVMVMAGLLKDLSITKVKEVAEEALPGPVPVPETAPVATPTGKPGAGFDMNAFLASAIPAGLAGFLGNKVSPTTGVAAGAGTAGLLAGFGNPLAARAPAPMGGNLLGGIGGSGQKGKDKPTINDMLALPQEYSTGYLFLYYKLDEIGKLLSGEKKEKKGGMGEGLGGIFSGLLKGAAGLALLAVSLVVFAGAMKLFGMIEWGSALAGLVAFGLFIVGMVGVADYLSKQEKVLVEFGIAIGILALDMMLFAGALVIMAMINPLLGKAIPGLLLFVAFVVGAVVVSLAMGAAIPAFLTFAAATGLLSLGLIAFGGAIFILSKVGAMVPAAIQTMADSLKLVMLAVAVAVPMAFAGPLFGVGAVAFGAGAVFWALALGSLALVAPITKLALKTMEDSVAIATATLAASVPLVAASILFAPAAVLLAAGFVAWSLALGALALANLAVPSAEAALRGSKAVLDAAFYMISDFTLVKALKLTAFSATIVIFSAAMMSFAVMMHEMGKIKDNVPAAIAGVNAALIFLGQIAVMTSNVENKVFDKVRKFGESVQPMADSLLSFMKVMKVAEELKDTSRAKEGISKAIELLIGDGQSSSGFFGKAASASYKSSILGLLEGVPSVFVKLNEFAKVLEPFSKAFATFMGIVKEIGSIDKSIISMAAETSRKTIEILESITVAKIDNGKIKNFTQGLVDFGRGLDTFLKTGKDATILQQMPALINQLEKLAAIKLNNTFDPLINLFKRKNEVDQMTKSLEKMANAIKPQSESIFTSIGRGVQNLTGGVPSEAAAAQAAARTTTTAGAVKTGSSSVESALATIVGIMSRWDKMTPGTITTTATQPAPAGFNTFIPIFGAADKSGAPIRSAPVSYGGTGH